MRARRRRVDAAESGRPRWGVWGHTQPLWSVPVKGVDQSAPGDRGRKSPRGGGSRKSPWIGSAREIAVDRDRPGSRRPRTPGAASTVRADVQVTRWPGKVAVVGAPFSLKPGRLRILSGAEPRREPGSRDRERAGSPAPVDRTGGSRGSHHSGRRGITGPPVLPKRTEGDRLVQARRPLHGLCAVQATRRSGHAPPRPRTSQAARRSKKPSLECAARREAGRAVGVRRRRAIRRGTGGTRRCSAVPDTRTPFISASVVDVWNVCGYNPERALSVCCCSAPTHADSARGDSACSP